MVAVQGFGRPVAPKGTQYKMIFPLRKVDEELHPGHCGYEFEPRESARWEFLKKILFLVNKLRNFLAYFLFPSFTSKYPIFSSSVLQLYCKNLMFFFHAVSAFQSVFGYNNCSNSAAMSSGWSSACL